MRIALSGGGTGGHIFPALAVAESLRRLAPDAEMLYIGGTTGIETEIVPRWGLPFQAVTARKLRKLLSPSTLLVALSLLKGYREARTYLRAFQADAVIGTGGYVAAAAVLAGARSGLPAVILAPDRLPGRTNRLLARFARRICVVFPETMAAFPGGKTVLTGMPVRADIVAPPEVTPQAARCRFPNLRPEPFTLLVIGGSQGAQAVNRIVLEAVPLLLDASLQVLHQTGAKNIEAVRTQAGALIDRPGYCPVAFLGETEMPLAFRAADIVLCRGGISTLAEVMVNALPAVVVPLPTAYADHQTVNAQALASAGAALVRPEKDLRASNLTEDLLALRDDPARRQRMADASRLMGRPQAADDVAKLVFELIS